MLRGEVWWVEFARAVGSEIRKTQPGVIVSIKYANRNLSRLVVVPLTSNTDGLYRGEANVPVAGRESKAMADQLTTASKVRLRSKIDMLPKADLLAVELAIRV